MIRHNGIEIDKATRTITHRGRTRQFQEHIVGEGHSIVFKSLAHLILGGSISRAQLFWFIYGDDPDGGPDKGPQLFCIRFHQWETQGIFRELDLEMRRVKIAGVVFYELVPTYHVEAKHARSY